MNTQNQTENTGFKMPTKPQRPSEDLIKAAVAVFTARAAVETLRPVIEEIQNNIFKENVFIGVDPFAHRADNPEEAAKPRRLMRLDDVNMLSEDDFKRVFEILEDEYVRAGFVEDRPKGHCPLLMAETLERKATDLFVAVSFEINIGIDAEQLDRAGFENYQKYVELMLKYVGIFIDKNKVMKDFKKTFGATEN